MKIGTAQVIVSHLELSLVRFPGIVVDGIFERIEQDMDIERVSIGVGPDLKSTWFVFRGAMR
jgi:hypothetical protein